VAAAKAERTTDDGVVSPVDRDGNWIEPGLRQRTSSKTLRGPGGLRLWEANEFKPRPEDVYQERLYCIRWALPDFERLLLIEQALTAGLVPEYDGWTSGRIEAAVDILQSLLPEEAASEVAAARKEEWGAKALEILRAEKSLAALPGAEWDEGDQEQTSRVRSPLRETVPGIVRAAFEHARTLPRRLYTAPTAADLERERRCETLLTECFVEWQQAGYLPVRRMEPGKAIKDPIRNRGWSYWHHLYTPRQLLVNGLFGREIAERTQDQNIFAGLLLAHMKLADWNGKLCRWDSSRAVCQQALYAVIRPTPWPNHACRATPQLLSIFELDPQPYSVAGGVSVQLVDAACSDRVQDLWITDPGYGDMAPYAEYSEFYLAWIDRLLPRAFPNWYTDSKRALAVELAGDNFAPVLHRCYANLAAHMPDDGMQVVMFTQQNTQVWADLTLLLWAAGLQVIQAWTIGTETNAGAKEGDNTVQGTVCLVLRKRTGGLRGDLGEIKPDVKDEVRQQLETMLALDDKESPNFTDSDLQLAAYAAALRVITSYERIAEIDVARELARGGRPDPQGVVRGVIDYALREATDYLVPNGLDRRLWLGLSPEERFYLKGIEVEAHGERRNGVYQEFARGFGLREFRDLLESEAANETRLRTPSELKGRDLETGPVGGTVLRRALYAVYQTASQDFDPGPAVAWLRGKYPGITFFDVRLPMAKMLRYLAEKPSQERMPHWKKDAEAAHILAVRLESES
jgi:hypothetical protein